MCLDLAEELDDAVAKEVSAPTLSSGMGERLRSAFMFGTCRCWREGRPSVVKVTEGAVLQKRLVYVWPTDFHIW